MTERIKQSLKFGSSVEATTPAGAVTAKSESQTLAAANQNRVALYVTNNGAKDVWLAFGHGVRSAMRAREAIETRSAA